jgi:UDP-GlcNAc:undecaprenyl-phosphate/decaprenyl-phosphate GlcNAc-1-phosphate transferase
MHNHLIYLLISAPAVFVLTTILVPLNIKVSKHFKMIDYPTEDSIHRQDKPLGGGLAIVIPVILAMFFINRFIPVEETPSIHLLIIGSLAITINGFLDDKYHLSAANKLIMQTLIVIFMYFSGFKIMLLTNPWNDAVYLGYLSFPATVLWFLLLINSFNLIDGIDGLATGIASIVALILVVVAYRFNNLFLLSLALIFFASNLAFLRFNFPPAKIFLGDTGSQFLGFFLAAISIAGNTQYKGITAMTLLIPIIVMFVPLTDTLLAILRRLKYRKSIFSRDQQHIHHKMLNMGLSDKNINYICYFITALFGLIAIGFSYADKNILFTILISLAIVVFVALYLIAKKELMK